jgi:hypothetical protein
LSHRGAFQQILVPLGRTLAFGLFANSCGSVIDGELRRALTSISFGIVGLIIFTFFITGFSGKVIVLPWVAWLSERRTFLEICVPLIVLVTRRDNASSGFWIEKWSFRET